MSLCRGNSDASFSAGASRRKSRSSRLTSEVTRQGQEPKASQGTALWPCKGQPGGDVPTRPHAGSWPALCVFVWLMFVCPSSDNSFLIRQFFSHQTILFLSSRKRYRRLKKTLVQFKSMIIISRPLIQRRKRCQVTTEQGVQEGLFLP